MSVKNLWLDCDPGHDDVCAILLALHHPSIRLLGISTVHGNASLENTTLNAARSLEAFGAYSNIRVYPGAAKPLIGLPHPAADIHGNDGLGGVEGLPDPTEQAVQQRVVRPREEGARGHALPALQGIEQACLDSARSSQTVSLGVTGAFTNAALFIMAYPDLAKIAIQQIVVMGGGVGIGNITATAEFNIYIDPEAAQIVFDSGIPVVCMPLNVTHQVLFHGNAMAYLLDPLGTSTTSGKAITPLRHTLSTLFNFFADTYRNVFGFQDGPPIHDMLVVAYIIDSSLFGTTRARVDVERGGQHTKGTLSVDTYGRPGSLPAQVDMALTVDVSGILKMFFAAIARADQASPLNKAVEIPQVADREPPEAAVRVGRPPVNQY